MYKVKSQSCFARQFLVNRAAPTSEALAFGPHSFASTVNATVGGWPAGSRIEESQVSWIKRLRNYLSIELPEVPFSAGSASLTKCYKGKGGKWTRGKHPLKRPREFDEKMEIGRRFAQYLLEGKIASENNLHRTPSSIEINKDEFISLMDSWFELLCACNRIESVRECAATAVDVFKDWNKDIYHCTGKILLKHQMHNEAIKFIKMALDCVDKCSWPNECAEVASVLDIREDLEQAFNRCIPRWHFRMINDISRNRAFFKAIENAVVGGCSNVVDIGAGSGILRLS